MPEPDAGLPLPQRLWAVVSLSAGSMLYTLDGGIPNVALPAIAEKLGIATSTAVLLVSLYNLVLAMALLPLAAVGERLGHRRVFIAGLLLYLGASFGCLFSGTFAALIVCRSFQALAAAGLLSVSLAMVRLVYPTRMLGRGLGFNTMVSSLGAACAPPLGGLILAYAPWQMVFSAGIPLAACGLAASRALPAIDPRSAPYDTKGALLCAVTFGLIVSGLQALGQPTGPAFAWGLLIAGSAIAIWFVRHEMNVRSPVLPVDLLAQPALALSVAGAMIAVLSSTILLLELPFRLHGLGIGSAAIGAMLTPFALTVMVAAPVSGMLSDKVPAALLGTIGMVIASAGLAAIAWLPTPPVFADVAWRMGLCGLGFSLFFSPNGRLVVGSVSRDRAAGASSLVATTRMLGQALGATSLSGMLALGLSAQRPAQVALALAVLGLVFCAARMAVSAPQR